MLTRKQHALLMYIHEYTKGSSEAKAPSFDEMKDALGLKSKSGVHRLVSALEERGFLRRLPHRARAFEIIRMPDDIGSAAKVVRPSFDGGVPAPRGAASNGEHELPLLGRIAAGTPIEALRDPSTFVPIPQGMVGQGEHYALEVEGDSMVEAGIHDGDTVVIRRGDNAENGEIVVALVDDNEATLKRLRRKGSAIALEPANAAYETRIYGPDRVKVQGRLVGLIRHY